MPSRVGRRLRDLVGIGREEGQPQPLCMGSRYAGGVVRISEESIINVSMGGGILPVIRVAAA
ncbi:MAG: hypothetical protein IH975_05765 [Nitrospinae bacterium]|nr:hypothetical protein [Nitrospinota bacterium]